MRMQAVVAALPRDGMASVTLQPPGCGGHCSACGLCCSRPPPSRLDLRIAIPPETELSPGDIVDIDYREGNAALAAFALFVPPLAGLWLGGLTGTKIMEGDLSFVLGAAAGCGLGLSAGRLAGRFFRGACLPSGTFLGKTEDGPDAPGGERPESR